MNISVPNSLSAIGFLSVLEDEEHGFFGGYLVLSQLGRPLEFHCSTPILPSKAQRILYGSTLRSFVLGELIGQTLVKKAQVPVQAVLTDSSEMLSLALYWQGVLACVASQDDDSGQLTAASAEADSPVLEIDRFRLTGSSTCRWSAASLQGVLAPMLSYVDLAEPFQRIREAILEAQRVTDQAVPEEDDHSAAA